MPDAGLGSRRQLAQQYSIRSRTVDRVAPHLREAWRRRSVQDSLRSVTRDPDGTGYEIALSVSERRRLQLPDRRLPRQGPGGRREGRVGLGLRRTDDGTRRYGQRQAFRQPGGATERLEETGRALRTRIARHGQT